MNYTFLLLARFVLQLIPVWLDSVWLDSGCPLLGNFYFLKLLSDCVLCPVFWFRGVIVFRLVLPSFFSVSIILPRLWCFPKSDLSSGSLLCNYHTQLLVVPFFLWVGVFAVGRDASTILHEMCNVVTHRVHYTITVFISLSSTLMSFRPTLPFL